MSSINYIVVLRLYRLPAHKPTEIAAPLTLAPPENDLCSGFQQLSTITSIRSFVFSKLVKSVHALQIPLNCLVCDTKLWQQFSQLFDKIVVTGPRPVADPLSSSCASLIVAKYERVRIPERRYAISYKIVSNGSDKGYISLNINMSPMRIWEEDVKNNISKTAFVARQLPSGILWLGSIYGGRNGFGRTMRPLIHSPYRHNKVPEWEVFCERRGYGYQSQKRYFRHHEFPLVDDFTGSIICQDENDVLLLNIFKS